MILLVLILLLFIFNLLFSKQSSSIAVLVTVFIIIFLESIRWNSATDFQMYHDFFENQKVRVSDSEILYFFLNNGVGSFTQNYTVFLFIHSILIWAFFYFGLKNFKSQNTVALMILFCILIGFLGANRQMVALAISFYAVSLLFQGKKILFVPLILVAAGFHNTALVMLPAIFFTRDIKMKYWISALIFVFLLNISGLGLVIYKFLMHSEALPGYFSLKLNQYYYFINKDNVLVFRIFGLIRKVAPVIILIYFRERFLFRKGYTLLLNLSMFAVLLFLVGIGYFNFLLGRLTIYYSVYECILYSWIVFSFLQTRHRNYALITVGLLSVVFFLKAIDPYPQIFIPYQTIFGTF